MTCAPARSAPTRTADLADTSGAAASARQRLALPFDAAEERRIKRLWVRHSIAEDRRDIDGLISTLAPGCAYEIVGSGLRWEGHAGARAFYTELFAAFPDN